MEFSNKISILILAGGFGTRLQSTLPKIPKILAPVEGQPFLYWLLKNLYRQGAKNIILLLHYKNEMIENFLKNFNSPLNIETVIEPIPLGTGGAVCYALKKKNY